MITGGMLAGLSAGISINTVPQLEAALDEYFGLGMGRSLRLYIPLRLFSDLPEEIAERTAALADSGVLQVMAALPYIMRDERADHAEAELDGMISERAAGGIRLCGVLARNLEELAFLRESGFDGTVEADYTVPVWNRGAAEVIRSIADLWTISPELSVHEIRALGKSTENAVAVVDGRTVMMISANCVMKNAGKCTRGSDGSSFRTQLRDRTGRLMPVLGDCRSCYNVIFNAVPTSLAGRLDAVRKTGAGRVRIDLLTESYEQASEVIKCIKENRKPDFETTAGRFIKGVE